ncbi:hypothetical protein CLAFUW4_05025 [Fulvia fulva]|nr:hypothetical protein CLAFUR4_05011 [Fulvia fulva]WPV13547.1 hypothetical protein CLAFUW4_05025 [Fulvia fulva]WPV29029.1 hypothetical protein CLAFUW7_05019 [Fulvia fulva]
MAPTKGEVDFLYRHLFLPPKLPQTAEAAKGESDLDVSLLKVTLSALENFRNHVAPAQHNVVDAACEMLRHAQPVHSTGSLSEVHIRQGLENMARGGNTTLLLHVKAQNAGLIVRNGGAEAIIEPFELSPLNKSVMTTKGRLVRGFPATAVAVPLSTLGDSRFRTTLAQTLSLMSHQPAPGMQPQARKSGQLLDEDRDTAHPSMVCNFLLGFLKANGGPTTVTAITKHTREEVMWSSARSPWRRSPLWLLIRVGLQLHFTQAAGSADLYKHFMVFFMAHVLRHMWDFGLSSDKIYIMNAKIVRRLQKLSIVTTTKVLPSLQDHIRTVLRSFGNILAARWTKIQDGDKRKLDLASLSTLDFLKDSLVDLPELDKYLLSLRARSRDSQLSSFVPTSSLIQYSSSDLPTLNGLRSNDDYTVANLQGFEHWVATHLKTWISLHRTEAGTPEKLRAVLEAYHNIATTCYARNPEAISVMLLTLMQLWVACDKSACAIVPLLAEYKPAVPGHLLQNLLLPQKAQMDRLRLVEQYLEGRDGTLHDSKLLFSTADARCFAAVFFDQSSKHQDVLRSITAQAHKDKAQKLAEFASQKAQYNELKQKYDSRQCEYRTVVLSTWNGVEDTEQRHVNGCLKCVYEREMKAMRIRVYEDPLPLSASRATEAKVIVFELDVPEAFACWRDTRNFILRKVMKGRQSETRPRAFYGLSSDSHLSSDFRSSGTRRIGLLSQDKPHVATHRNGEPVSTARSDTVCRPTGLAYKYYDSNSGCFVDAFEFKNEIPEDCTYQLPAPSKMLQKYMDRPAALPDGPGPNVVIANLHECPAHMALDEYRELCTVPLGHQIQWHNILVQLRTPGVDFKKLETTLFILQCIYQVGPPDSSTLRSGHAPVVYEDLARLLLVNLHCAVERVKANWESANALASLVAIAARVLSLTSDNSVKSSSFAFLAQARDIAFQWMISLREKAHRAADHSQRGAFLAKSVEVALICVSTFDVDDEHLPAVLASREAGLVMVQCSIVVRDGARGLNTMSAGLSVLQQHKFKRLLHRARQTMSVNHAGLDDGIKQSWSAYQAGTGWAVVGPAASNWLATTTKLVSTSDAMSVHYNILTGELLVRGHPLNRPPQIYEDTQLYSTLFGKAAVEVMPSSVPGMQFSTKREFAGYAVNLGIEEHKFGSNDLLVRAQDECKIYETVPSRVWQGAFPVDFKDDFVHWYNSTDGTIEFRPKTTPWDSSSPEIWLLSRDKAKGKWQLSRAGSRLLSRHSQTSQQVSKILDPLANDTRIHVTTDFAGRNLTAEIPKLMLGFSLKKSSSDLMSKEHRGMQVDEDQSLGTLIGFQNKLMLKHKGDGRRLVLLPESKFSYAKTSSHVTVSADKDSISRVHDAHVDPQLGRLVDHGSQESKIMLAYLHALTSFCLTDPLTGLTGTEQALTLLASASMHSFLRPTQDNLDMLAKIAGITPGRDYYPANEKVMQTVSWDAQLSCLSQHGALYDHVNQILARAQQSGVFYPDSDLEFPEFDHVDAFLHERDTIRSSAFRVAGFGAESFTTSLDMLYQTTDRPCGTSLEQNAYSTTRLLSEDAPHLCVGPGAMGYLWKLISSEWTIFGSRQAVKAVKLRYDAGYLTDWQTMSVQSFPSLHQFLTNRDRTQALKYDLMMWLSTLACSKDVNLAMIQILALFCTSSTFAAIVPPTPEAFFPKSGKQASKGVIKTEVSKHTRKLLNCPENSLKPNKYEKKSQYEARQLQVHQSKRDSIVDIFVENVYSQWPCENPDIPQAPRRASDYIKVQDAMVAVKPDFQQWYHNRLLFNWLVQIEDQVETFEVRKASAPRITLSYPVVLARSVGHISIDDLFSGFAPSLPQQCRKLEIDDTPREIRRRSIRLKSSRLVALIEDLGSSAGSSKFEKSYIEDLRDSQDSLLSRDDGKTPAIYLTADDLTNHLTQCEKRVHDIYTLLEAAVNAAPPARESRHWPRVSPGMFLSQLARDRWAALPEDWQKSIVEYALALTALQRAARMLKTFRVSGQVTQDLVNELRNSGHTNWDATDHPESLLIEVESAIMIREVQEDIAAMMRQPPSNENSVMQLNMGEGKSSVIVPIVAAALADGKTLTRVIVAKPQSKQMAEMLISKLGGLVNRRIYYMPFSRSLKLTVAAAETVASICRECMEQGGIMLVQPEHILSFKLMAPECYISGYELVGRSLMKTQDFFDSTARDIVDESDENFSVHFELIYTMGSQRPIDMSPYRWLLVQEIMSRIRSLAPDIASDLPDSLEISPTVPGSFARIRILKADAEARLVHDVSQHICDNGVPGLPIHRQAKQTRDAVFTYITQFDLDADQIAAVENSTIWTDTTKDTLLLLRGLLAGGVLAFVFGKKRWRVNYGTAVRTPPTKLAVPYRAKDNPSPCSEFSHPDVVIMLTSLCHYYDGLHDEDMFNALRHLMKSHQAEIEYQAWVKDANNLPTAFMQVQGINLKDEEQCTSVLFPCLNRGKSVVDYFLAHIVFPKEMKEFPHKLSASGWDVGKSKTHATTGFSGTCDSKALLPLSVKHLDLPKQKHTNALVLEHLLQPENSVQLMPRATMASLTDAERLLQVVVSLKPQVQVILDVGAQILELDNFQVAQKWLEMHGDQQKEAVVFVDDNDELQVVNRGGRVESWKTSSYVSRPDACLVFLDEAHTRGIDIKLPPEYRAAVTLGANLTKDRLVQACMRMRKLGKGQTVVFCVSDEIQSKILACTGKGQGADIGLADVLRWSITETWSESRHSMPLWTVQGQRFVTQEKTWQDMSRNGITTLTKSGAERLQEPEAESIDDRYRPLPDTGTTLLSQLTSSPDPDLQQIVGRCSQFDDLRFDSSTLQEEQERELSPEIEQERQVQRPSAAQPEQHQLHDDVIKFVQTGVYQPGSEAYTTAFRALSDTTAAKTSGFNVKSLNGGPKLLITADCARTVKKVGASFVSDQYQRHVQWVLTSQSRGSTSITSMMIVSPVEAQGLLAHVRASRTAALHLFKARTNMGYSSLDQLNLFTMPLQTTPRQIPRALSVRLQLFSGQLYITSFEDYLEICKFLGLSTEAAKDGWDVAADGFILKDGDGRRGGSSGLTQSPVQFLKVLMTKVRRNGEGISKTHMGKLLEGALFQRSDFDNVEEEP